MRFDPKNTVAIRLLKLGQRPQGVTTSDLPDKPKSDVGKICRFLIERGLLTRLEGAKPYRHVCTKADETAWLQRRYKINPPDLPKQKKQRVQPVLSQIKARPIAKAQPTDHKDMHWPVDADGNPLWTHTVCPGFTGQPHKTNTFTGAY